VAKSRKVVGAHCVPVEGRVKPVPAVERGEVGQRADRLVPVKNPGYDQTSAEFLCWLIVNVYKSATLCWVADAETSAS
jgi:hypothetical protein